MIWLVIFYPLHAAAQHKYSNRFKLASAKVSQVKLNCQGPLTPGLWPGSVCGGTLEPACDRIQRENRAWVHIFQPNFLGPCFYADRGAHRFESLSDERGREKGFEALYDMSATKTIVANHG
jgi:hypothetical protein